MKLSLASIISVPLMAFALASSACTPASRLSPPAGFAELEGEKSYDYRATSARGIVVAVRTQPNSMHGNVDFWADAIDLRLRREGYAPEAPKAVETTSGLAGKQLRYTREDEDRRTYCYWLTVFATNDRVYLVEAGGDKENFEPAKAAVERAVVSLRAN